MRKTAILILLCIYFSLSFNSCPPVYAEKKPVPFERELSIPIFSNPRLHERTYVNDISVVYPELLLSKGIEAMVAVEFLIGEDGMFKDASRIMTYQLSGYKCRYDEIIYRAVADFDRKSSGFREFEDEVLKALSKNSFQAEKEIRSSRKETARFYFDKYDVYARTLTLAENAAIYYAAQEAFRDLDLEIELIDREKGIIRTRTVSGLEGRRKCESSFILKIEKAADPDVPGEIRVLRIVKMFYPPYEEGRTFFRIVFPYHRTSKDLLERISRRLNDADARIEFISPRIAVRNLFPVRELSLTEMYPDALLQFAKDGIKKPKQIRGSRGELKYPHELLYENVEGFAVLIFVVDRDGLPKDIEVAWVMPEDRGLEEATISAYSKWKFRPAMKDGKPVKVIWKVITKFDIR